MPSNCSDNRTATNRQQNGVMRWFSLTLDWPIERVVVAVEVEPLREPNPLEWAILCVFDEFPEHPPTLEEITERLCIGHLGILRAVLDALVELGGLASVPPQRPPQLSACRLTDIGRRMLARQSEAAVTERHGMEVLLDAVTHEYLSQTPEQFHCSPSLPVISPERLPARRTHIGMDLVRDVARMQNEPFQTAESRIINATVRRDECGVLWAPVPATLAIEATGRLRIELPRATPQQQRWINNRIPNNIKDGLGEASSGTWRNGHFAARSPIEFAVWRAFAERLLAPADVATKAASLIHDAAKDVVVHAAWSDAPGITQELAKATDRGVQCVPIEFEAEPHGARSDDTSNPDTSREQVEDAPDVPMAIVVDGTHALRVDEVKLNSRNGGALIVELAASVKFEHVDRLRRELIEISNGSGYHAEATSRPVRKPRRSIKTQTTQGGPTS